MILELVAEVHLLDEVRRVSGEGGVGHDEGEELVDSGRVEVELEQARVVGGLRDGEVDIWECEGGRKGEEGRGEMV